MEAIGDQEVGGDCEGMVLSTESKLLELDRRSRSDAISLGANCVIRVIPNQE